MNTNFKTALFGGFDREDVVSYIQQTSRENQQRVSALEEENHGLQERNRAMEAELNTLRRAVLENSAAADTCLQLQTQLRELQEQAQKLQKETEYLRAQAAEYQSLKDHIADIEISAHRRTEEFRAKAIEQLRQLTRQQETWCAQSRAKYAELNRQFCQKLALAQQTLAEPGPVRLPGDGGGPAAAGGELQRDEPSVTPSHKEATPSASGKNTAC